MLLKIDDLVFPIDYCIRFSMLDVGFSMFAILSKPIRPHFCHLDRAPRAERSGRDVKDFNTKVCSGGAEGPGSRLTTELQGGTYGWIEEA